MPTESYTQFLHERLKDPEYAEYLTASLEESPEFFFLALTDVAEAHNDTIPLSNESNLSKESLDKILSENGDPRLYGIEALLEALGFRLSVTANPKSPKRIRLTDARAADMRSIKYDATHSKRFCKNHINTRNDH